MIVYEATKLEFIEDTRNNLIVSKIECEYRKKVKSSINEREETAWRNSMQFMKNILEDEEIPNNCGVAIEYVLPISHARIDFILTGKDKNKKMSAIIIELKQWTWASFANNIDSLVNIDSNEDDEDNHKVVTPTGGKPRKVSHPSYQVESYAEQLLAYNEAIINNEIVLYPCAYLHNYREVDPPVITSDFYKEYLSKAPAFLEIDYLKFKNFIKKYVKYGDNKEAIYLIENGKIKPSKSLQDCIASMIKQNKEFILSPNQNVVYKVALNMADKCIEDNQKRCLIVKGGPGTGKTVLAINLLSKLTNEPYELICQYVTKNNAVRNVFKKKLKGTKKNAIINDMFKSSSNYVDGKKNEIDVIIIDEAHRLTAKSTRGRYQVGENQVKEIINTSKLSIFFIDERQRVTLNDIGTVEEIQRQLKNINVADNNVEILELKSQYRCNGSDEYLEWLDDILEIESNKTTSILDLDYEIKVFDNPFQLRKLIKEKNKKNNKSRLVAGYCWNWKSGEENNPDYKDIQIKLEDGRTFEMTWNMKNKTTWAIDDTVDEAGCIHTVQGLEFDYIGVIIGKDLRYENGHVITDFNERASTDRSLWGIKKMYKNDPQKALKVSDEIIKNTYRTLMTRGQKGCYIYCVDKSLADYLKKRINQYKEIRYPVEDNVSIDNLMVAEESEEYKYE